MVHLVAVYVWAVMLIPTLVWWRDSILWISFMSLYAIVVSHWSAYEGAKAKDAGESKE